MSETVLALVVVLIVVGVLSLAGVIVAIILGARRPGAGADTGALQKFLTEENAKTAEALRAEFRASREELNSQLGANRKELSDSVEKVRTAVAETQQAFQKAVQDRLEAFAEAQVKSADRVSNALTENRQELTSTLQQQLEKVQKAQTELVERTGQSLAEVREKVAATVTAGLKELQEKNEAKLEQMRLTVDEKLHQTLETRLTQTFDVVTKQLIEVQKGLTEMQSLAQDVGGLKRALTNVKTRGVFGEAALQSILSEYLTPEQFIENAPIRPRSSERVEFAVKMPGVDDQGHILLPIDSKFPREDYERIQDAMEQGDKAALEQAGKDFEKRLRSHAAEIAGKYIHPPHSTDFAIMFLPFESIFAEAIRRAGLFQDLERQYKVILTGPTTLTAFINSLQVGFKTLAISKRSAEVWKILGAVKTEFSKFGEVLASVQRNLETATSNVSKAAHRAKQMERKLSTVEALPIEEAQRLLPGEVETADEGD